MAKTAKRVAAVMTDDLVIHLGTTAHIAVGGSQQPGASWATSDPAVATVAPDPRGRSCAVRAVGLGTCQVTAYVDRRLALVCVRVVEENTGLDRLKLVGRDIPA